VAAGTTNLPSYQVKVNDTNRELLQNLSPSAINDAYALLIKLYGSTANSLGRLRIVVKVSISLHLPEFPSPK
jgi:hypothetical protein